MPLSLPSLFPQALSKDQPLFKTASRSLALAVVRPRIFTFTAPPIPFKVEFNHFSVADQQSLYHFLRGSYVVAFMRIRPYVPQLASFSIGPIPPRENSRQRASPCSSRREIAPPEINVSRFSYFPYKLTPFEPFFFSSSRDHSLRLVISLSGLRKPSPQKLDRSLSLLERVQDTRCLPLHASNHADAFRFASIGKPRGSR